MRLLCFLYFISILAFPATSLAQPSSALPQVFVYEVTPLEYADRIEAIGTLKANETVDITANVSEKITKIHFEDGQRVGAGEVLAEMTSEEEQALLEEERATKAEAKRQLDRIQKLVKSGSAARSLLDQRKREFDTATARLRAIESRMDDRLIHAPFAGVVGLRNISVGALVTPGDLITTLDDDSIMKLDFSVPSTFLEALRAGMEIKAKARAFGDTPFVGKVKSIDSRVDPVTRSIVVRAEIPNTQRLLKPGLLMSVTLLKNPRQALLVPEETLVSVGKEHFLYVVDAENKVERRNVSTGTRQKGVVEIREGISAGERVITHGQMRLRPGQEVSIRAVDDGTTPLPDLLRSESE